jgi:DNA-directed RNA polymerase specialized sigma24 family protein
MNERDYLAERFEAHRTHLRAVAYRMLGSLGDVDDAVQDWFARIWLVRRPRSAARRSGRREPSPMGTWLDWCGLRS